VKYIVSFIFLLIAMPAAHSQTTLPPFKIEDHIPEETISKSINWEKEYESKVKRKYRYRKINVFFSKDIEAENIGEILNFLSVTNIIPLSEPKIYISKTEDNHRVYKYKRKNNDRVFSVWIPGFHCLGGKEWYSATILIRNNQLELKGTSGYSRIEC
jgi:hypothetical protein